MSAPALPEIFGNYTLGEFVEVVSPEGVSWLPQTAGWYWLGAGLLVLALRYSWKRLKHWHRNRYRKEAVLRLTQITTHCDTNTVLGEVNRLMKLAAVAGFSREQVASLTGETWVAFLNGQCNVPPFDTTLGDCLAAGPYRKIALDETTLAQLVSACERWLLEHRGPEHA